ncbi:hypothetical protein H5410_045725 [Solanum commersonii]|uniref:Uncharacterized protein n=1 Tax=Solanum commersonii TaxID=4109 RepID=A0A9J5XAC6_SOLCO|nr:hypothetical protein H5410_045725 [Solanum commersonii]
MMILGMICGAIIINLQPTGIHDHILEEVNREELDMPTNMEEDEEETFEEDEWIDEEETSEDDAFSTTHFGTRSHNASTRNVAPNLSPWINWTFNLHLESNGSEPNTPPPGTFRMHIVLGPVIETILGDFVIEPLEYKYDLIMFYLSFIYLCFN